ncbi:SAM-dependent methyltransferase [Campylobacterota bacterium]|nr:SAM-dependent methyltransferase [Campylobacterota bacterium]
MTPFSAYAHEWLYGANGYYASVPAIGRSGDFFTSVSASRFFGGAIANYLISLVQSGAVAENAAVCEFGAHGGHLMADIAQFVYTLEPRLLGSLEFVIIEPFAQLRAVQNSYIRAGFGEHIRFRTVQSIDEVRAHSAFVYANELFDAFAFDLINGDQMAFADDHRVVWQTAESAMLKRAEAVGVVKGELFAGFEAFAVRLAAAFERCEMITFDYGTDAPRNDFSARIYRDHQVFPLLEPSSLEPFFAVSDLTADTPFWHLAQAFTAAGFESFPTKAQNAALIDMGLTELLKIYEEKAGFAAYRNEVGRVRTLIDPSMLGERFRFCRFRR